MCRLSLWIERPEVFSQRLARPQTKCHPEAEVGLCIRRAKEFAGGFGPKSLNGLSGIAFLLLAMQKWQKRTIPDPAKHIYRRTKEVTRATHCV